MGKGFTLSSGAIATDYLNKRIEQSAKERDIPLQLDLAGRDTGTDAMAGVLASVDAAATSIGFPIRNMHTISEAGNTSDVLAAIHAIYHTIADFDSDGVEADDFKDGHARLDLGNPVKSQS
jgi:endoglucanase